MKYRILILVLVLLAMNLTLVYAGNERRIGTAGAQELRIPVGARGTAMGGAVVADAHGMEAIYWNPAGLANLGGTEAMFSHQPYIADIDINFVGIGTYIEDFGTLAIAAKIVSIGDMEETTDAFPDGTGRIYSPTLSVLSLSYSRILTNKVSFGITGKFIHEDVFEVSANGIAFDIGFIYNPGWQGVSVGIAIRNYGPEMRFSGSGFNYPLEGRQGAPQSSKFDLPSSFNLGVDYDFIQSGKNVAGLSGNFKSNNYSEDNWQGGLEYVYDGKYSLRGGYNYSEQDTWLYGLSAGAGAVIDMGGTNLILEYAWTETAVFDANMFFTVRLQF